MQAAAAWTRGHARGCRRGSARHSGEPEHERAAVVGGCDSALLSLRLEFGRLVWRVGADLQLGVQAIATAATLLQQYLSCSPLGPPFDHQALRLIAIACVWLAGKACEDQRPLRDIVNSALALLGLASEDKLLDMGEYWKLRDGVVAAEGDVLRAVGFEAPPSTAHLRLVDLAHVLLPNAVSGGSCGPGQASGGDLATLAWSFLNDSHCTDICVRHMPDEVAAACIVLAIEVGKNQPRNEGMRNAAAVSALRLARLRRMPGDVAGLLGCSSLGEADRMPPHLENLCREILLVYDHGDAGGAG